MKCPKCGYVGFEDLERCRNCGYDFSLTSRREDPDLPIRTGSDELNPLEDLALIDAATSSTEAPGSSGDSDRMSPASRGASSASELPLFGRDAEDDSPLITRASPPRPPLAVRRATPEVPRLRAEQPRAQAFDLSLDLDDAEDDGATDRFTPADRATAVERWPDPLPEPPETASVAARLVAVVIDLVILAAIDLLVVYLTMQICGITMDELGILPKGPLAAFLLVQNGGYLVAFTAGGQTLGKMAAGIRVVPTESAGNLDMGRALTRTVIWLMLAVPAGLGFLTLFSRDHRGLHDRFAGTRVVRASA